MSKHGKQNKTQSYFAKTTKMIFYSVKDSKANIPVKLFGRNRRQSYKASTSVNYNSRILPTFNLLIFTTQETLITTVGDCFIRLWPILRQNLDAHLMRRVD